MQQMLVSMKQCRSTDYATIMVKCNLYYMNMYCIKFLLAFLEILFPASKLCWLSNVNKNTKYVLKPTSQCTLKPCIVSIWFLHREWIDECDKVYKVTRCNKGWSVLIYNFGKILYHIKYNISMDELIILMHKWIWSGP